MKIMTLNDGKTGSIIIEVSDKLEHLTVEDVQRQLQAGYSVGTTKVCFFKELETLELALDSDGQFVLYTGTYMHSNGTTDDVPEDY